VFRIVGVDGDDFDLFPKFDDELATCSARSGERICGDGNGLKVLMTLRDRFADCGSLGANAKSIRGVLNIAAGVDGAVGC